MDYVNEASFPVVFHDGEREGNMGSIRIRPSLDYKNFQSVLSQTIGISPHQISVYLVDNKGFKIPVNAKFNFSAISRGDINCFFLVVLKRSRRDKRRVKNVNQINNLLFNGHNDEGNYGFDIPGGENRMVLLRRNNNPVQQQYASEYENRMRELQMQKEWFLTMSSNPNADYNNYIIGNNNYEEMIKKIGNPVCEQCESAKREGSKPKFHSCVNDPVVVYFRSTAGPVSRPVRGKN